MCLVQLALIGLAIGQGPEKRKSNLEFLIKFLYSGQLAFIEKSSSRVPYYFFNTLSSLEFIVKSSPGEAPRHGQNQLLAQGGGEIS